ncbi:MAG: MerR family transcriptional regulator [Myxococcota bacterium]
MSRSDTTGETDAPTERRFRIGAVAKMTGIPTATLRTWERRYEAVQPSRSEGGERLYTLEDVTRLQLLRESSDLGKRISELTEMDNRALRDMIEEETKAPEDTSTPPTPGGSPLKPSTQPIGIAVIAHALPEQLATAELPRDVEIVSITHSLQALRERGQYADVDIVLVELDLLGENPAKSIGQCIQTLDPGGVIVLFDFATASTMKTILATGARMMQAPARLPVLHQEIRDLAHITRGKGHPIRPNLELLPSPDEALRAPKRRFRDDQLARLRELSSDVECECPNHLAGLVSGLLAFEQYSRGCESKNPEDASLHRTLASGTGKARQIVEELLLQVCIQDGLDY